MEQLRFRKIVILEVLLYKQVVIYLEEVLLLQETFQDLLDLQDLLMKTLEMDMLMKVLE